MAAFLKTMTDFENSETGNEKLEVLQNEMGKISEPYGVTYMKKQIQIHFDDNVDFVGKLF